MRPRGKHKPFLAPKTGAGASPLSGYGPQHQHPHTNPVLLGCLGALPAIGDAQVPGAPALYQHQAGLCSGVREKHRSPSPTHSLGRAQMGPEGGESREGRMGGAGTSPTRLTRLETNLAKPTTRMGEGLEIPLSAHSGSWDARHVWRARRRVSGIPFYVARAEVFLSHSPFPTHLLGPGRVLCIPSGHITELFPRVQR